MKPFGNHYKINDFFSLPIGSRTRCVQWSGYNCERDVWDLSRHWQTRCEHYRRSLWDGICGRSGKGIPSYKHLMIELTPLSLFYRYCFDDQCNHLYNGSKDIFIFYLSDRPIAENGQQSYVLQITINTLFHL